MSNHRVNSGWAYYLKNRDKIKVVLFDDEHIQLEMPGSKPKLGPTPSYLVSCVEGFWRCDCEDFFNRWQRHEGAYGCKHVEAAHYKIAELKGVNLQGKLNLKVKGVS